MQEHKNTSKGVSLLHQNMIADFKIDLNIIVNGLFGRNKMSNQVL